MPITLAKRQIKKIELITYLPMKYRLNKCQLPSTNNFSLKPIDKTKNRSLINLELMPYRGLKHEVKWIKKIVKILYRFR